MTTRQGFGIPDIPMTDIEAVNREAAPIIRDLEQAVGVAIDNPEKGYPAAGTRNVCACIGSRVCQFANKVFRDTVLQGVALNPEAEVADRLEFKGEAYALPKIF